MSVFGSKGFDKTSMRDVAEAFGVLPGSLYHHFGSKDELFIAVYAAGVDKLIRAVEHATQGIEDPWQRLEAACVAQLTNLLGEGNPLGRVLGGWSMYDRPLGTALIRERDRYERLLRRMLDEIDLPVGIDRTYFRLSLLGALNWSLAWYKPGRDPPDVVARNIVSIFRPVCADAAQRLTTRRKPLPGAQARA